MLIGEELMIGNFVPPGKGLDEMRKETMARVRSVSTGFMTAMEMRDPARPRLHRRRRRHRAAGRS